MQRCPNLRARGVSVVKLLVHGHLDERAHRGVAVCLDSIEYSSIRLLADLTELAQQLGQLTTVRRHRFPRIRHFLVSHNAPCLSIVLPTDPYSSMGLGRRGMASADRPPRSR